MLQIYLYGPTEQGFLDINPETVLDVDEVAEAFDEDLRTGTFTLPADLPWTDKNRRLFGFSERLENNNKIPKHFKCDVYDDGWPEMIAAQLTILEKNGAFSYSNGSFSASIAGTKGLFGTLIKNKKMTDLKLGGTISWVGKDSREFAYDVMTGAEPGYPHISFAPVAIEGFIQIDRPDYLGEFLAKDTVNTIVIGGGGSTWVFGRPTAADPTVAATAGSSEYIDYRTVPFFNLKYVLKKVFEENNFSVSGAFLESTDFDDIFMFNNYAIDNFLFYTGFIDINREITPANHMPDISIADFLRGVFSLFNIYPSFKNAQDVKLVYRHSLITDKNVYSLNPVVDKVFNASFENTETQDGYTLDYEWDSADQYYSDRLKDLSDKTFIGSVQLFTDLETLDPGRALTTNDYAYVEAENLYYLMANSTVIPKLWDAYAEGLDKYVVGKGETAPEIKISPMCQYVEFDTGDALYKRRPYVGTRQPGSYRNNKGTLVKNSFGLRIFYIKNIFHPNTTIPQSFTHNRFYFDNTLIEPYSLAWGGEYGLAKNFHNHWQQARSNAQMVKTNIRADHKILSEIDASTALEVDSILYLPYKKERSIPNNGSVKMHLMLL